MFMKKKSISLDKQIFSKITDLASSGVRIFAKISNDHDLRGEILAVHVPHEDQVLFRLEGTHISMPLDCIKIDFDSIEGVEDETI